MEHQRKSEVVLRDPTHLSPLPEIKLMPRWDKSDAAFVGFVQDIRENGIQHPLLITNKNKVVDGETRRQGALVVPLGEVPCIVVSDDEVQEIILRELVRRRNLTKGQLAYLVVPKLETAFREGLRRRAGNASKTNATQWHSFSQTAEEYAVSMGFSRQLLDQARRLHAIFDKNAKLKAEFEPLILDFDKPIGIGACLAGIGGSGADQSKREDGVVKGQLELFHDGFDQLAKGAKGWKKFDPQRQSLVLQQWRKTVAAMPQDMRTAMIEALEEAK